MRPKAKWTGTVLILMTHVNNQVQAIHFIPLGSWAAHWCPHQPAKVFNLTVFHPIKPKWQTTGSVIITLDCRSWQNGPFLTEDIWLGTARKARVTNKMNSGSILLKHPSWCQPSFMLFFIPVFSCHDVSKCLLWKRRQWRRRVPRIWDGCFK